MCLLSLFIWWGYNNYSCSQVKALAKEYFFKELKKNEDEVKIESFISNLAGKKNFMVEVKINGDDKIYYYYQKDNNLILESYRLKQKEYVKEQVVYKKKN